MQDDNEKIFALWNTIKYAERSDVYDYQQHCDDLRSDFVDLLEELENGFLNNLQNTIES